MVSVIIPALNEGRTIGNVVRFSLSHPYVSEVIVIDDRSTDNTVEEAATAGASIIISQKRGKGISMQEGINAAKNEVLVFLDGDIDPYPSNTISFLSNPIIYNQSDFVKATFSRNAGRVTELVAKPLLALLFPELSKFSQPLSGMIAGRKSFFSKIDFIQDYGVDIGILIDMHHLKARISEICIGHIENKSKPWQSLTKMSTEVAAAILHRSFAVRMPSISLAPVISEEAIARN